MTRENKVGLLVTSSFLCLVGAVVGLKLQEPEKAAPAPTDNRVADLNIPSNSPSTATDNPSARARSREARERKTLPPDTWKSAASEKDARPTTSTPPPPPTPPTASPLDGLPEFQLPAAKQTRSSADSKSSGSKDKIEEPRPVPPAGGSGLLELPAEKKKDAPSSKRDESKPTSTLPMPATPPLSGDAPGRPVPLDSLPGLPPPNDKKISPPDKKTAASQSKDGPPPIPVPAAPPLPAADKSAPPVMPEPVGNPSPPPPLPAGSTEKQAPPGKDKSENTGSGRKQDSDTPPLPAVPPVPSLPVPATPGSAEPPPRPPEMAPAGPKPAGDGAPLTITVPPPAAVGVSPPPSAKPPTAENGSRLTPDPARRADDPTAPPTPGATPSADAQARGPENSLFIRDPAAPARPGSSPPDASRGGNAPLAPPVPMPSTSAPPPGSSPQAGQVPPAPSLLPAKFDTEGRTSPLPIKDPGLSGPPAPPGATPSAPLPAMGTNSTPSGGASATVDPSRLTPMPVAIAGPPAAATSPPAALRPSGAVTSHQFQTHTCQAGETLQSICSHYYGSEAYATALDQYNRKEAWGPNTLSQNDGRIVPGGKLIIPDRRYLEVAYSVFIRQAP